MPETLRNALGQWLLDESDLITSVPVSRKTHRAGKYERYFDFKWLKLCAHVDVYHIAVSVVYYGRF